jgi:hypothetical protein
MAVSPLNAQAVGKELGLPYFGILINLISGHTEVKDVNAIHALKYKQPHAATENTHMLNCKTVTSTKLKFNCH